MSPTEYLGLRFEEMEKRIDERMDRFEKHMDDHLISCQRVCILQLKNVETRVDTIEDSEKKNIDDISDLKKWRYYYTGVIAAVVAIGAAFWDKIPLK